MLPLTIVRLFWNSCQRRQSAVLLPKPYILLFLTDCHLMKDTREWIASKSLPCSVLLFFIYNCFWKIVFAFPYQPVEPFPGTLCSYSLMHTNTTCVGSVATGEYTSDMQLILRQAQLEPDLGCLEQYGAGLTPAAAVQQQTGQGHGGGLWPGLSAEPGVPVGGRPGPGTPAPTGPGYTAAPPPAPRPSHKPTLPTQHTSTNASKSSASKLTGITWSSQAVTDGVPKCCCEQGL